MMIAEFGMFAASGLQWEYPPGTICLDVPIVCQPDGRYNGAMEYRYTGYFENEVLRKRPYLQKGTVRPRHTEPIRVERQEGNRFRFWGAIEELGGAILRVVTLDDKTTIHNAFPDRRFKR